MNEHSTSTTVGVTWISYRHGAAFEDALVRKMRRLWACWHSGAVSISHPMLCDRPQRNLATGAVVNDAAISNWTHREKRRLTPSSELADARRAE